MVSKKGKAGYRSFTVVSAAKRAGCATKGLGGRFINKTPSEAARKAFSDLCRVKRIRGVCTLFVTMKDTTKGGKKYGKLYTYKLQRQKLAKPMIMLEGTDREFVIEYKPRIVRLMKGEALKCDVANNNKPGQTRGRPKKRTAKKTKVSANNVRRLVGRSKRASATPVRFSTRTVRRSKRLVVEKN